MISPNLNLKIFELKPFFYPQFEFMIKKQFMWITCFVGNYSLIFKGFIDVNMFITMLITGGFMDELNNYWNLVKEKLYSEIANVHFNTWILPITPIKMDLDNIYLNSNIPFIKKIVKDKYLETIAQHFHEIIGKRYNVVLLDSSDPIFNDVVYGKIGQQIKFDMPEDDVEVVSKKEKFSKKPNLNPKYVFSNFVKGNSNDFALAIAESVAENPGVKFNPLFIYGGSGLGKTHLMQAIGHEILKRTPNSKVLYITSENFMNEFISTITDNKNSVINSKIFREKYRNADVLMIDDIQFIAGKEGTQEEIFHTFNSLREAKKQIILTSDKIPAEIENLEQRLVTRFSGGIMADIKKPDFETRVAILNHKIKIDRLRSIPNVVVEFIAENVTSNIRELEGAIINVDAHRQIIYGDNAVNDELFLELAKKVLSIKEKKNKQITLELIKEVVTNYYKLGKDDLLSKSKKKNIAEPRQVAMYISRQLVNCNVVKIATSFDRDHSTIIHGDEKIAKLRLEDDRLNKDIENIIAKIKNS